MVVFLDIILFASELNIVDQITVFQMIEEALEIIGISDAELLFEYLEERLDRLVVVRMMIIFDTQYLLISSFL